MLDSYSGLMDFTLTEEQACDIEYGIVEFEIYFSPDCTSSEYGINVPSVSMSASPIETSGFKTADGMSYVGVGGTHDLDTKASGYAQPGEIITKKCIFSILKNYTEDEYVFCLSWYDGEIVAEKARSLYFANT